jgi:hypothetical protein
MTLCSLSGVPFPGATGGTLLHALVNDPENRAAVSPDVDRDGDGLEQVVGDGADIVHCVDGDGTVIAGADCPCEPRIVDGYSVAIGFDTTTAELVGVQ